MNNYKIQGWTSLQNKTLKPTLHFSKLPDKVEVCLMFKRVTGANEEDLVQKKEYREDE